VCGARVEVPQMADDKKPTQEQIENLERYARYYDRNAAFRLLKTLRKKTRKRKWLVSKSMGTIVSVLGHLLSALDNPETPKRYKAAIIVAIGYILLPLDSVPDFIPIIGYSDDAMAAGGILALVISYSTFKLEDLDADIDRG